ncbi:MAG: 50S ribosomal protein L29 [Candidatus Geothermincolia bacterium]
MIKANELRILDEDGLRDKLRELKETLFNLRFQHATGQLDNPMKIKETRRDIAKVCTVMTEREFSIHLDAFEEALAAPIRQVVEEPEEMVEMEIEAEIEEDLEELAEAAEKVEETEEQLEEEVEEELKDL